MLLEGIFLPLTTPFHPDGRLYLSKLESNVRRYSLSSVAGMLVGGPVGEAGSLTDVETRDVLRSAISAAADEKVMIANVGRESVHATLELAETAAALGYDVVSVAPPAFAATPGPELLFYFLSVADRSPLPVLLSNGGQTLELDLVRELAGHPNIIGLQDAHCSRASVETLLAATRGVSREVTVTTVFAAVTGRMLRHSQPAESGIPSGILSAAGLSSGGAAVSVATLPVLKTRSKRIGFQVLAGSAANMLDAWRAGASGAVPALAACAPQGCSEVWQAFRDGDDPLAAEKQERIRLAAARSESPRGIAALKFGCDLNGYFGGRPRLPRLPLVAEERSEIERELAGLRN